MPPHDNICDTIQAYIDDLSQTQLRDMRLPKAITDHVRTCNACKAYLDQMLALADRLDAWDVPEPNKSIGTGVMAQIAQLERNRRFNLTYLGRQCLGLMARRIRIPAAVAAVLILGLCVSVVLNVTAWQQADTQRTVVLSDLESNLRNSEMFTSLAQSAGQDRSPTSEVTVIRSTDQWQSLLGHSLPAPSTFVIILGAPPFPLSQERWLTQPVNTLGTGASGASTSSTNTRGIDL